MEKNSFDKRGEDERFGTLNEKKKLACLSKYTGLNW